MAKDNTTNKYNVPALDKTIAIIELLADQTDAIGISQLCKQLDVPKTSAFYILNTLEKHEYIKKTETSEYMLGNKIMHIGLRVLNRIDIRAVAKDPMEKLLKETGLTVHLAILEEGEAMYVEKKENDAFVQFSTYVGQKQPLHASAVGKALAAYLPDEMLDQVIEAAGLPKKTENTLTNPLEFKKNLALVRELGYAVEDEEGEYGIRCIGAPIFNYENKICAAISVTAIRSDLSVQEIPQTGEKVKDAAIAISKELGFTGKI